MFRSIDFFEQQSQELKEYLPKARALYDKQNEIYCPYFHSKITLNSDGFNHLQNKSNRMPRAVGEQIRKLTLLKKALEILPRCGTLQEYRDQMEKYGKPQKNGFYKMKRVQYWGFHAILANKKHKIKIILKQIGDGNIIFWSVMPYKKMYDIGIDQD